MVEATDKDEMMRQNDMIAKANAKFAKGGDAVAMPISMADSKSVAEFYSDLLSYSPAILNEAVHKGDSFERFKLTLKFAFSILHNLTLQDVF